MNIHKRLFIASILGFLSFLAAVLSPASLVQAQDATATPAVSSTPKPIPPLSSAGRLSVVYTVPGMEDVEAQTDIDYLNPPTNTHLLDLYLPDTEEPAPLVVLIHGSASARERLKDQTPYTSWGRLVAASGFAAVTFNWDYPKAEDITALFEYMRENSEALNIDTSKICIAVFSGGVDTALSMVQAGELEDIACLVAYYGDYRQATAGLEEVDAETFPDTLILHGARDEGIPLERVEAYVESATALDLPVSLMIHPEGVHAFDLRNDDETTRELMKASLDFIAEHLLPTESEGE